jgi:hypothetical protein
MAAPRQFTAELYLKRMTAIIIDEYLYLGLLSIAFRQS